MNNDKAAGWKDNRTRLELYWEVLRVNHWFKNIFVLIGSFAAFAHYHLPFQTKILFLALLVFLGSCLISSVNYIINGIVDKPFDARHPRKMYRAIPQGLIGNAELLATAAGLLLLAMALSVLLLNAYCSMFLFAFFVAGVFYNIRPVRLKDVPYLDVVSEAANNPIRLLLGWFALAPDQTFPPTALVLLFWFFGCFLMTAKRYAEFRYLREDSYDYRITFRYYSERSLYLAMMVYLFLTFLMFVLFSWSFKKMLLYSLPGTVIFVAWFLLITAQEDSMVKEPEKIYVHKAFFIYSILLALFMLWLSI